MPKGYRFYETDFQPGYIDTPAEDHLPNLSPDKQRAEAAIRAGDPRGRSRAHALYLFEDLNVAKGLLSETKGEQLYECRIDIQDILHRGDLRIYDQVVEALKNGRPADELIREYWAGVEREAPRIELVVNRCIFVRKIVDNT
jgi:hypothetical protein